MTEIYYVRVGPRREYLHVETEGREGEPLREYLASVLLPDVTEGADRTAKVRCHKIPPQEAGPTTILLDYDTGSNQFKFNGVNVGGFR
jgi:hypothetical protein